MKTYEYMICSTKTYPFGQVQQTPMLLAFRQNVRSIAERSKLPVEHEVSYSALALRPLSSSLSTFVKTSPIGKNAILMLRACSNGSEMQNEA
jgi:hypothetical protein